MYFLEGDSPRQGRLQPCVIQDVKRQKTEYVPRERRVSEKRAVTA